MNITNTTRVADIATLVPASIEVFERYGVDFCCHGDQALDEALRGTGLSVGDILAEIERVMQARTEEDALHRNWSEYAPGALADHIEQVHHQYLREQLPKVGARLATVLSVHGDRHPELFELGRVFARLRRELEEHLAREESLVFPLVRALDPGYPADAGRPLRSGDSGALLSELARLEDEHDTVGDALKAIRGLTANYQTPPDACVTYSALYQDLQALEADIHRHVHLENNILIPAVKRLAAE